MAGSAHKEEYSKQVITACKDPWFNVSQHSLEESIMNVHIKEAITNSGKEYKIL